LIRRGIVSGVFVILALFAGSARGGSATAYDNAFRAGWSLLEKEQYAEARAEFGRISPPEYDLGDYAVFFAGTAAAREGDRKAASDAAEALGGKYPASPLVPYLAHEIAFAAALDNDLPAARKALAVSRGKVAGNGRKAEERYVAALLAGEGEPTSAAAALHLENFSVHTAEAAATRSYELLWQWWTEGRIASFDLPVEFYGKLASAANRAGDTERARKVYEEAVRRFPPSDGYYAMVLDFAEFHRRLGETSEASALLSKRLADAPPAFRSDMRFLLARIDWKAGKLADAKSRFLEIAEGDTRPGTADRARYYAAWIAEDEEDLPGATAAFGRLRRADDERIRQEALFRYAYGLYRQKAFDNAAAAFDEGEGGGFGTVEIARHRFWRARALRAAGRAGEADLLLGELADDPYAGVYALFAVKERGGNPFGMLNAPSSRETDACGQERDRLWAKVRGGAWEPADAEKVRRADRLVHLGVVDFAVIEAQRVDPSAARKAIGLADGGAPGLFRYLAGDLKGAIRETAPLVLDPANPGLIDRIQYPLAPEFLKDCDRPRSGLDPLVLHAIIRQESAFQADALSPAGAVGLMQLMPRTAAETARREKLPRPRRRDLTRPALNVRLGAAYLSRLVAGYKGDYFRAVAAYNAGESAVGRWWGAAGGDPATYLEGISYRETRFYVRRVFFNLLQYYRIYRPEMFARHFPTVRAEGPPVPGAGPTPAPSGLHDNVPSTPPTPEAVPSVAPPRTAPGEM
jgi:soluble lytic murein transglycosylase-like protein